MVRQVAKIAEYLQGPVWGFLWEKRGMRGWQKVQEADDFKLKKSLWKENDKEIRYEMDQKDKVRDIIMPTNF